MRRIFVKAIFLEEGVQPDHCCPERSDPFSVRSEPKSPASRSFVDTFGQKSSVPDIQYCASPSGEALLLPKFIKLSMN
jgi:hypothetical protein